MTKKKSKAGKKKGSVRRYSSGSATKSRLGRSPAGKGTGWIVLYHDGSTGDTKHDKTWAVRVQKKGGGYTVVTRHGKRGGEKNETSRGIMAERAAEKLADRLMNSKLNKGYRVIGAKRGRRQRRRRHMRSKH